jgi:TPR repeat protein
MKTVLRAFVVSAFTSVALATSGVAQSQDVFSQALQAYEREDYLTVLRLLRPLAVRGDTSAQFSLGVMYQYGQGVRRNDVEAVKWYRLAADQGKAEAQCYLGIMYSNGYGVPKNDAEAARWYRLSAEQGFARAQAYLGAMYADGELGEAMTDVGRLLNDKVAH